MKLPLALTGVIALLLLATGVAPPAGRFNWFLEVAPGLAGIGLLAATYSRQRLSKLVYVCVFLHMLILIYGGYYTYAKAPLGEWVREALQLQRNHYDRLGHLALGFFPALLIREILLKRTPLRKDGWLTFIILAIALAIGAFWELIEWWTALLVDPATGDAFLGSQGDIWDAQWDMLLALVGAAVSLATLSKAHDRSMATS
jgi:putative membrane protein